MVRRAGWKDYPGICEVNLGRIEAGRDTCVAADENIVVTAIGWADTVGHELRAVRMAGTL